MYEELCVSGDTTSPFLTLIQDGGELLVSRPGHFTPSERALWFPLHTKLFGPQCLPGRCGVEKNNFLLPENEPRPSCPNPATIPTELSQLRSLISISDSVGNRTLAFQPLVSNFSDCAVPVHILQQTVTGHCPEEKARNSEERA
jgi:hypothetical protein